MGVNTETEKQQNKVCNEGKSKTRIKSRQGNIFYTLLTSAILIGMLISGCSSAKKDSAASQNAGGKMTRSPEASKPSADMAAGSEAKAKQEDQKASVNQEPPIIQTAKSDSNTAKTAVSIGITPAIGTESADGFNRKLIYKANVTMQVDSYNAAQTQLRDLVALSGAYILQFSENAASSEKGGNYTIKVAAGGFVSLLDGLEKMSPSLQRNIQGQDVTEEYVDLSSRLKAKQAVESRLLAFMEKASKTDDLLAFSNELSKVQEEIERIKGRIRYLDQNVSYSTIELRMYEKIGLTSVAVQKHLADRVMHAMNATLDVIAVVFQGLLIFIAGALPILIFLGILAIPALYYRRRRNSKLAELRSQLKQTNKNSIEE